MDAYSRPGATPEELQQRRYDITMGSRFIEVVPLAGSDPAARYTVSVSGVPLARLLAGERLDLVAQLARAQAREDRLRANGGVWPAEDAAVGAPGIDNLDILIASLDGGAFNPYNRPRVTRAHRRPSRLGVRFPIATEWRVEPPAAFVWLARGQEPIDRFLRLAERAQAWRDQGRAAEVRAAPLAGWLPREVVERVLAFLLALCGPAAQGLLPRPGHAGLFARD